jgi:S1-C subfamily serine protease
MIRHAPLARDARVQEYPSRWTAAEPGPIEAMSLLFRLVAITACLLSATAVIAAEDTDAALSAYAVSINRSAADNRSGTGIYLGKGLVLTASHVVGQALLNRPKVTIAGQDLPARVLKQDTFERSDLALLAIDEESLPTSLRLRRISLCEARPWPGEDVITVIPEETVHSHVISPQGLPLQAKRFNTIIADVARTGNSGSGVFDTQKKCLLGIMSRKISQVRTKLTDGSKQTYDIAKYFVSASIIAEFLPAEVRLGLK